MALKGDSSNEDLEKDKEKLLMGELRWNQNE